MVQQCNEYFDRPFYFNEMADALDGSTQNIMNVFSFGATDYVGATQTDTFQGWQWDWQRGLLTFSREMLISAATGGSGTMMRTSTGAARYAWGGVWLAGLGYDSYNMGQHSSQAYEDFRQGDIRGGLWHTGLAVVSAFGIRAGLKGSALGKAGSTVDESSALAKVADEAPSKTAVTRPSARQSELDVSSLNPGHRPQVSFSNGREVSYGSRGSVRPDNYRVGEALEVKNYDLSQAGNRANLYNTIHEQYLQRISNLPRGTQQRIVIDIRGQNVSEGILMRVRSNILTITRTPNVTVEFLR